MTKTEVGYTKGGKTYKVEKNFGNEPRAEIVSNQDRAVNLIDKGTKVTVKGTGKARKQTATWF